MCEKTQRDTTNFLVLNMSAKLNTQQNLRELAKLTLLNILQTKGLYYQKYQRLYQQKHQSSYPGYLPKKF
jgi:UDP-glucose 6-dehydrogenase